MSIENEPYDKVGQLVMLHNSLEAVLSMLLVSVAGLSQAALSFPVVSALDYNRKAELLKELADALPIRKSELKRAARLAEDIGRIRNKVAHGVLGREEKRGWVIKAMAGARMMAQQAGAEYLSISEVIGCAAKANELIDLAETLGTELKAIHLVSAQQAR